MEPNGLIEDLMINSCVAIMAIVSIPEVVGLVAGNSRSSSLITSYMIALMESGVTALAANCWDHLGLQETSSSEQ